MTDPKTDPKSFGTRIPAMRDIAKIDGDHVIDKDGEKFTTALVKTMNEVGGGFELVDSDLFGKPRKRKPE